MKLLSYEELRTEKGINRTKQALNNAIAKDKFPKPIKFCGANSKNAWLEEEIDCWLAAKIVERNNASTRAA